MQSRTFIPLIDRAFLSLGAVFAILSQTQLIKSLAVEVTEIEQGIAAVSREHVTVITITLDGLYVDGQLTTLERLCGVIHGPMALVRVDRSVPTERLIGVMGMLASHEIEIRIEVDERPAGI